MRRVYLGSWKEKWSREDERDAFEIDDQGTQKLNRMRVGYGEEASGLELVVRDRALGSFNCSEMSEQTFGAVNFSEFVAVFWHHSLL
jgi:hypothetical protein